MDFFQQSQVLMNLLPLTPEAKHILFAKTFEELPLGAVIMNTGRGRHLNAADLLAILDSGHLGGAILDVFEHAPLSSENPLWHYRILL
jgi:glyoxylate/hydroxypyruvate reductase A